MTDPKTLEQLKAEFHAAEEAYDAAPKAHENLMPDPKTIEQLKNEMDAAYRAYDDALNACEDAPKPTGPSAGVVHCVMTKDARGDGVTDDSDAFIAALAVARSSGVGTVYIPPGIYKITKPLTVPAGVELRGCNGGPINPNGARCILLNLGSSTGAAFITTEDRSGASGFTVLQPEQVALKTQENSNDGQDSRTTQSRV